VSRSAAIVGSARVEVSFNDGENWQEAKLDIPARN